ncbi:MAG: two-component system response regulator RegX3 [Candidatus Poriferisodalaceae bacterium]|jgi:two-component system response regulator RegX3|tara:strand:- start:927 stop:1640 length:714 start_codon:yes stop_codon:yes gene_type:complete
MIPTRVLVIDDEPSFTEALSLSLKREGFEVDTADDGVSALSAIARKLPDLILLDVMLPGMSGVDVCREIRKTSTVPIIMVTARGEEIDAVVALEVGADDYVTKPYRLRELVARMRAVLRRSSNEFVSEPPASKYQKLVEGDVTLDLERHELRVREVLVTLALKEFELLTFLIENAGRVVTRDSLMENVWGYDYFGDTKTIDVHVKRLRTKIESNPAEPTKITTIRGLGYRYEKTKST